VARENRLWGWLRKADGTPRLMMERVENAITSGTPDVTGCFEGSHFWIELKSAPRPKRPTTPVRFPTRTAQVEWHEDWWKAGCSCWWLVQVGHGHSRAIYMLPGHMGAKLHEGMTEVDLASASVLRSSKPTVFEVLNKAHRPIDISAR
jgi:hypothetical protein